MHLGSMTALVRLRDRPAGSTLARSGLATSPLAEEAMKEGYRFVDCDMHIMEPPDLFDKYLDPEFKHRVTSSVRRTTGGPTGMRGRPLWYFDGTPTSNDGNVSQYNRIRGPLVSKRANTNVMFAVERGYDAESQVMGMAMEGIDIAVLFPTAGLSFLARDNMDPQFSAAICRAYNDWIHDFVQHSPDQLKMAAMLPMHDVNLACAEAAALRQRLRRGRRLRAAELPQWPLLAFELLGPALFAVAGTRRPDVLPRGHRVVLFDDRAALRRKPLHAPCREPFDRDAIGADRADARRHVRVLSEAQGRLSRSAELVGAGSVGPHRMGHAAARRQRRALSEADAVRILAAQLLLGDRKRREGGRLGRRTVGRRRQHLRVERFPAFRLELPGSLDPGHDQPEHHARTSPARSCPAAPASTASARRISPKPTSPPSATTTSPPDGRNPVVIAGSR